MCRSLAWLLGLVAAAFVAGTSPAAGAEVSAAERALVEALLDEPPDGLPMEPFEALAERHPEVLVELREADRRDSLLLRAQEDPAATARWSPRELELLAEALERRPERLSSLLPELTATRRTFDAVAAARAAAAVADDHLDEEQLQEVDRWLAVHGPEPAALLEEASRARDGDGMVEGEGSLVLLAERHPQAGRPLLERLAAGDEPRTAALALGLLHRQSCGDASTAAADDLEERLLAIVRDREAPGGSRHAAIEALAACGWPDDESELVAWMADPTLRLVRDGIVLYSPLAAVVRMGPDRWIPVLAGLVGDEDPTVHAAAVDLLVDFQLESARADALLPLLPWLDDPAWAPVDDRLRLVQSVGMLGMEAAIPGLIRVLDNGDEWERSYAAESLSEIGAPQAVPALRAALEESTGGHARRILRALVDLGGVGDEEAVNAVVALARRLAGGAEAFFEDRMLDRLDHEVTLGELVAGAAEPPGEPVVAALLAHAGALAGKEPAAADWLGRVVVQWPTAAVDRDLAARLAGGAEGRAVDPALLAERLRKAPAHPAADALLRARAAGDDTAAAIAAVLLRDERRAAELLERGSAAARAALLAASRIADWRPLPASDVARLLADPEALVAFAAHRWLASDRAAGSHRLLLAHHPGQALIVGQRPGEDPGHETFGLFDDLEEALRREVTRANGPDEILALLSGGYWGGDGHRVVRVRRGEATVAHEERVGRGRRQPLPADRLAELRAFLEAYRVDDLPPLNIPVFDGIQFEYLHLTRDGGRRVYMNNPGFSGGSIYDLLVLRFLDLTAD